MKNPRFPTIMRLWAAALLTSWGNLSDQCVTGLPFLPPDGTQPQRYNQKDFGQFAGIGESTTSVGLSRMRAEGIMDVEGGRIKMRDCQEGELFRRAELRASRQDAALLGVKSHAEEKNGDSVTSDATFYKQSEALYLAENPGEAEWFRQRIADRERLRADLKACRAEIEAFRGKIRNFNRDRQREREQAEKKRRESERFQEGESAERPPIPDAPVIPFPSTPCRPSGFSGAELQIPSMAEVGAASGRAGFAAIDESSTRLGGELHALDPEIQTPSRFEPPNSPEINADSGRPLNALKAEGTPETTTIGELLPFAVQDVVVVAERLTIAESDARKFLAKCGASLERCTLEDVLRVVASVSRTINQQTVVNPTGVILRQVPINLAAEQRKRDELRAAERRTEGERRAAAELEAANAGIVRTDAKWEAMPEEEPERRSTAKEQDQLIDRFAASIYARHPTGRRCSFAEVTSLLGKITKGMPLRECEMRLQQIDRAHAVRCSSEEWTKEGGQYAKGLANWLAPDMRRWEESAEAVRPVLPATESHTIYRKWQPPIAGEA